MLEIVLHPGRERSVRRRHPWILSGAVASAEAEGGGSAEAGAWTRVRSASGEVLGYGHFSPHSKLRVRLLAFGAEATEEGLVESRIAAAGTPRRRNPLRVGMRGSSQPRT